MSVSPRTEPSQVHIVKMHGTHNEFVLIDERPAQFFDYAALARRLCDPSIGPGADGLLVVSEAQDAQAAMRIINADGSEAEMCGNGVRCVARYLSERGAGDRFTVATLAGPIGLEVLAREPEFSVRVDVGEPSFPHDARDETLEANGATWRYVEVSLGNPHAVVFVDDVESVPLREAGAAISNHPRFPAGTNVHFTQVLDAAKLRVRHFERGAGATQACGTGAVAAAAAAMRTRGARTPLDVHVPGGVLRVEWQAGAHAFLTGPAVTSFERTLAL
jgi:diaminopimelate epimerase